MRCAPADTAQFRIEVEDNGIGINSEDIPDSSWSSSSSTGPPKYAGTGLGLALTKREKRAREGSIFHVVLPRTFRSPDGRVDSGKSAEAAVHREW